MLYDVNISKALTSDPEQVWGNTYIVEAADLAEAKAHGQEIAAIEKAIHRTTVLFLTMDVRQHGVKPSLGTVVSLTGTGADGTAGEELALFNTVRVAFRPNTGKPSQKYLRLPLIELNTANGRITSAFQTAVLSTYASALLAKTYFVDPQGQAFASAAVMPQVQERQLTRRRRPMPGMKRGWVPKGTP